MQQNAIKQLLSSLLLYTIWWVLGSICYNFHVVVSVNSCVQFHLITLNEVLWFIYTTITDMAHSSYLVAHFWISFTYCDRYI